jgi:hypothetical protein
MTDEHLDSGTVLPRALLALARCTAAAAAVVSCCWAAPPAACALRHPVRQRAHRGKLLCAGGVGWNFHTCLSGLVGWVGTLINGLALRSNAKRMYERHMYCVVRQRSCKLVTEAGCHDGGDPLSWRLNSNTVDRGPLLLAGNRQRESDAGSSTNHTLHGNVVERLGVQKPACLLDQHTGAWPTCVMSEAATAARPSLDRCR